MRHIKVISHQRPARAQFEPVLQLVAAIQALLSLLLSFEDIFGLMIPNKNDEG